VTEVFQSEPSLASGNTRARRVHPVAKRGYRGAIAMAVPRNARPSGGQWWNDPNFSHGFFVPLFSAFVVWQERPRLASLTPVPSWWGLPVLGFGTLRPYRRSNGCRAFSFPSVFANRIAGLIVLFLGWNFMHALLFPWPFYY